MHVHWYIPVLCASHTTVWEPFAALLPYSMRAPLIKLHVGKYAGTPVVALQL